MEMTLFQLDSLPQRVKLYICCFIYSVVLSSIHINFADYIKKYIQWNLSIKKREQTYEAYICRKISDSMNIGRKLISNTCTCNLGKLYKKKTKRTKTQGTYHVAQLRVRVTIFAVKKQ